MGLLSFITAGGGFILIGIWELICSSKSTQDQISDPSSPLTEASPASTAKGSKSKSSSSLSFGFVLVLSLLVILNSLVSVFKAVGLNDKVGSVLQLQVLPIASLFFLYSVLGLFMNVKNSFSLPKVVLDLIALFGFVEEFFLFYLQKKDTSGIENRYFDLLLVPILICVVSTVLALEPSKSRSNYATLVRGMGLILQGLWFLQMGLSFFTGFMAHGCALHEKSRGNYTIRCKGHPEYHRARAIATLQFNLHLALLVVFSVGLYSMVAKGNRVRGDFLQYKPLGAEMQPIEIVSNFTLDSDEDEIKEEDNMAKPKVEVSINGNGYGSHE
ncbi:hypothetical protein AB3S75_029609 [Citrus x aurantiifolia]